MKECVIGWCHNTHLVFSGIDAVILGIPTETYCYDCANIYAMIKNHVSIIKERENA